MSSKYPWYEVADDDKIMQGDFIPECPIIIPPSEISEEDEFDVTIKNYDVIIMSQSCDIEYNKIDLVLLCPVWPLEEMEKNDFMKNSKGKEELRRGNVTGYHLLNNCELEDFIIGYRVVDFRNVYSVPLDFIKEFNKSKRLRLLPPYREHLSQAFARFFMRVGLPVDIPPFK